MSFKETPAVLIENKFVNRSLISVCIYRHIITSLLDGSGSDFCQDREPQLSQNVYLESKFKFKRAKSFQSQ